MTLFKQLAILITVVFTLLLSAVVWNDLRSASRSLQGQMETMARDMATTLGLALANSERGADPAAVETFFNAVFDSGYLAEIELYSPTGALIHAKRQEIQIDGVPAWFVDLVPLEAASGETSVMKGWTQMGQLRIKLHPGYAYLRVYESQKSLLLWLLGIGATGMILLWWSLHITLKPLKRVRAQADAIQENRFIRQTELPRTSELRRVVQAMNRMVDKVQTIFTEQSKTLTRYHDMLYKDELTGLGNRRELLNRLDTLEAEESSQHGHLALVHFNGLDRLAERDGYASSDRQLAAFAESVRGTLTEEQHEFAARVSKCELAIYLDRSFEDADSLVKWWFDEFRSTSDEIAMDDVWLCAGLVSLRPGMQTSTALSDSDFALTRAKATGGYTIVHDERSSPNLPKGRMQWRAFLQSCIAEQQFFLVAQPVLTPAGDLDHREVFVRLRDASGEPVPAGMFMPMASALGLDQAIDMEVFRMVIERADPVAEDKLVVNLASTFFTDPGAMAALEQLLGDQPTDTRSRLQLEARHFLVQQHPESAELVYSKVKSLGYAIGIDNLDLSLPLEQLQILGPSYVKVSARILADLAAAPDSGGLRALRTLTGGMDIRLMALGVDSPEVNDAVTGLGVDAVQGHFIAVAEALA